MYAQSCDYPVWRRRRDFNKSLAKPLANPYHIKFMPFSECLVDGIPEDVK